VCSEKKVNATTGLEPRMLVFGWPPEVPWAS